MDVLNPNITLPNGSTIGEVPKSKMADMPNFGAHNHIPQQLECAQYGRVIPQTTQLGEHFADQMREISKTSQFPPTLPPNAPNNTPKSKFTKYGGVIPANEAVW